MDAWLRELATALGAQGVAEDEIEELLGVARDVAHSVERKATPVATFLLGTSVERRIAAGASRADAFAGALGDLRATLPPPG